MKEIKNKIASIANESLPLWGRLVGIVMVFVLTSCDKDVFTDKDDFTGTYTQELRSPISTILSQNEEFSEYTKLLNYCDMYNALNQSTSGVSFTAFVPNNAAMKEFYNRRGIDSLQCMSVEYAKAFVKYHTVLGSISTEGFVTKKTVTNLADDDLPVAIDSLNAGQAWLKNQGHIIHMGDSAYNGFIYTLDKAITPLVETAYDRISEDASSSIMKQAIDAAGWTKELSTIKDTVLNEDNKKVVRQRYFTVLNVTNDVFAKAGINSFDALKSKLQANNSRGISADSLLREYVGYHILGNSYDAAALGTMSGSDVTRIWGTSAKNQVMTITVDTLATDPIKACTFNALGDKAMLTANSNIESRNGFIHNLDSWMPVWEPQQQRTVWDLADYTEIKNLVDREFYQPKEPTAQEKSFRINKATCFEYEASEGGSKNKSYGEIDYVTCKSNTKDAVNLDRVVFNLGYMGWVKMQTPTIVRGKYKVEISVIYLTDHGFMRQVTDGNGGMIKLSFDGKNEIFAKPYTKITSALPGVYTSTLYDEIEFPETAAHEFNMVIMDPAASSNAKFSLQIDCITFTPVE